MAKKYKFVRMPLEIYNKFENKKIKMEEDLKQITGKKTTLTMPKVWRLVAKNPVEIDFNILLKSIKVKKLKKR